MKLLQVLHGYPPETRGGTEHSVQALAHGLARRGHEVVIVAGSMQWEQGFRVTEAVDREGDGPGLRVRRIHRADLYFDHWQKGLHAGVAGAFREILREERPDVVHVHHWIRLSRDLVRIAARESIPAVVTLHDFWTTCLITFRVRPDTRRFCEAKLAADPCLSCAALVPPRTPWVDVGAQHMALAKRREDLRAELTAARALLAPSRAHARNVERFLGFEPGELDVRAMPLGRDLELPRPEDFERLAPPAELERLVLGAWGNLNALKGTDLLIEALGKTRAPERIELHLAGAEVEAGFLADLRARAEGLNVHFHGEFDGAQLARHPVANVHCMVSGTRAEESWGLVLDEAVALGLPLVLPRSGAFPEHVPEGRGALFYEPLSAQSLATALDRLLDEPALYPALLKELPPLHEVCPTVAQHVAKMELVYAEVAAAGAPPASEEAWFAARIAQHEQEQWDEHLRACTAVELGFEAPSSAQGPPGGDPAPPADGNQ